MNIGYTLFIVLKIPPINTATVDREGKGIEWSLEVETKRKGWMS